MGEDEGLAPVGVQPGQEVAHDGRLAALGAAEAEEETTAASSSTADEGSDGTATTALVLAVLGLAAGLGGLALGWSARRRTVSP